jgi:hypothetical protein
MENPEYSVEHYIIHPMNALSSAVHDRHAKLDRSDIPRIITYIINIHHHAAISNLSG